VLSELRPVVIRLQSFYDCFRGWVNTRKPMGLAVKHCRALSANSLPIFVSDDRELRIMCDFVWQRLGELGRERVGEMIETAAHVLDHITNEERERIGWYLVGIDLEDAVTRLLRIGFQANSIRATIQPDADFALQIFQVMMRPRDLEGVA
jgi:hypothetical protein